MKQLLFDFLFGGGVSKSSPNSTKGLKEHGFLKPSLHSAQEAGVSLTSNIAYRLERAKRKTIGFIVNEHGLTVRAPRWVSREEIETLIHAKEAWIQKKLAQFTLWQAQTHSAKIEFVDGVRLPYLGGSVQICLDPSATDVKMIDGQLVLNLPLDADSVHIRELAQRWFKNEAKRYLGARLVQMASVAEVEFDSWKLSSAQKRWGCCTSARTIRLNWKLIHLAPELIDYVVAHELAHLNEMNHGPKFWAEVERLCPQFQDRRRRLKEIYISQLPF